MRGVGDGTGPGKGASIRVAGRRQVADGSWYGGAMPANGLSRSLSLLLSRCVGGDVEDGSGGCSAEENGKKGRWMEWRLGMIRRRTDWVAGFAR